MAVAQSILGVALPLSPLTSVEQGDLVVRWIAPDEWLISLPNDQVFDLETRFRTEMNGHHSLVNGSGGMTVYSYAANMLSTCSRSRRRLICMTQSSQWVKLFQLYSPRRGCDSAHWRV